MNLKQWVMLFLIGVLLVILSFPTTKAEQENGEQPYILSGKRTAMDSDTTLRSVSEGSESPGKTVLEKRLEEVLSSVSGVGQVQTLIMTTEKNADYFSESTILVTGILIVAEGADNPVIIQNIKEACVSLFQLEPHKIKIMKMK